MTLVAADLLNPAGEIDAELFYPGIASGDVTTKLNAYLTQGYTRAAALMVLSTDTDEFARLYSYYRSFSDVVNRLTLTPASSSIGGDVSMSFLQTQINSWIAKANGWQTQYLALIPLDPNSTAAAPGVSQSIAAEFTF